MNRHELSDNVYKWSKHWGILDHSSYYKQIEYFFSERAELFTTHDVEDSYGDQMVCLLNAQSLIDEDVIISDGFVSVNYASEVELALSVGDIDGAINALESEILSLPLSPLDCYKKAWDAISVRALLIVDGKLVKWDNLTHPQRLELARSGKMDYPGIDLHHCKSLCSDFEWSEIFRARR